jgi:hypothetical protein
VWSALWLDGSAVHDGALGYAAIGEVDRQLPQHFAER